MCKGELALLLTWGLVFRPGLCGELVKVAYQPSNILDDYTAYRHVSIIHYKVPRNAVSALFKFTIKEEKTGGIGSCSPRNVSLYLKSGSIPLVHPDGSKTAAKLLKNRRQYYSQRVTSDNEEYLMKIFAPAPGDWYSIAFRSWTDPDAEHISQQGLGASCDTVLDAEFFIESPASYELIADREEHVIQLNENQDSAVIEFLMKENCERSNVTLWSSCDNDCNILGSITSAERLGNVTINDTKAAYLTFRPNADSFHYLSVRLMSGKASNISYILPGSSNDRPHHDNSSDFRIVPLQRKSLPDFFYFDYEHVIDNSSSPVNLSSKGIVALKFGVEPISDVGGTLTVGIKLANGDRKDVIVFGCVSHGYYSSITAGGGCVRNDRTTAPDLLTRSVEPSMVHVPYPEPGNWYLTLKAFAVKSPCTCWETCDNTSACKDCPCLKETSANVEISVGSSPCVEGRCSSNGHCVNYLNGGFIFSACQCTGGYRGFDCADDTYVLTGGGKLVRLLMLTLSNLAFIGSIYVAIRREYYTEAIVYTAVMLFSTLYHACEAGDDVHNYCLLKLSILQFCDFFNALLSIWVTLVAMASFGSKLTSFCQLAGAIVIALGSELNRTALWVFLLPAVTGCLLICISWGSRCKSRRTFRYPLHPYRNIDLPAGILLVLVGLVCYAFLQTRRNYHLIHSLWHVCVAIGVVLLLPAKKCMK